MLRSQLSAHFILTIRIPSGSQLFGTMWLSLPSLTQDDHTQHNSEEKNRRSVVAHMLGTVNVTLWPGG